MQMNDHKIGIVTLNHIIVYELLVIDRNTWYDCMQTKDYRQIKSASQWKGSGYWKYSYDTNQTFTNESNISIK